MLEELAGSGRKIVGFKQVSRAIKAGELKKVFVASDADEELKSAVIKSAEEYGVEYIHAPGKKRLGELCGISVSAACAGIVKNEK